MVVILTYGIRYYDIVIRQHIPALPKTIRERILQAINERLALNPMSFGKPLRGSLKGHRRLRVGDYRVIYRLTPNQPQVEIVAIAHRKDIYDEF